MPTFTEILGQFDIIAPDPEFADLEVPILKGMQRQGDILIRPIAAPVDGMTEVPAEGIAVVVGDATGNTHRLVSADGPVFWLRAADRPGSLLLGTFHVPDGSVAYLIHDSEHGANGIAPGVYGLLGKQEQADLIRRVAD